MLQAEALQDASSINGSNNYQYKFFHTFIHTLVLTKKNFFVDDFMRMRTNEHREVGSERSEASNGLGWIHEQISNLNLNLTGP